MRISPILQVFAALLLVSVAFVSVVPASSCVPPPPPPRIVIESPDNGLIIDATSVLVSGTSSRNDIRIAVNGVDATFTSDTDWEATVPLDTENVVTPIDAVALGDPPGGDAGVGADAGSGGVGGEPVFLAKDSITVLAGPSLDDDDAADSGVAIGFTQTGVDSLIPLVSSLAGSSFDITSTILTGESLDEGSFMHFDYSTDAYDADVGGFSFDADFADGQINTTTTINDIYMGVNVFYTDNAAISNRCKIEIDIESAVIEASLSLGPDASRPTKVDVNQIGDVTVMTDGLSDLFIDGPCDPSSAAHHAIEDSMGSLLEDSIGPGFEGNLEDPDGAGPLDAPIADGIQQALSGIDIAGEVGNAVGLSLNSPIRNIAINSSGVVMTADALFTSSVGTGPGQCDAPAGAPDLTQSFQVPSSAPSFDAMTPSGQPYSLGLAISASSINQLIKGMIECGLLSISLTEVEIAGAMFPVTTSLFELAGLPELAQFLGAGVPLVIELQPKMAPFLTGDPGPGGEMAEIAMPFLLMKLVDPATDITWVTMAIDTRLGLNLGYDPDAAQLAPTVNPPPMGVSTARVIHTAIGVDDLNVEQMIVMALPLFFQSFSTVFGSFPLPTFFGLDIADVEVEAGDGLFKLYANLNQAPETRISNVVMTDMSDDDFETDSPTKTREWRHRIKVTDTPKSIDARYRAGVAVDALFTTTDESVTTTADYAIDFTVTPAPNEYWQLDINHRILGALTLLSERISGTDGGETAEFTSDIQGSYSIDGGDPVSFNFTPTPNRVHDDIRDPGPDIDEEVTGSSGVVRLYGTTAQDIHLEFTWDMRVHSNSNAGIPAIDGGEAAIRLGMHDTLELGVHPRAGFHAGEYPGPAENGINRYRDITQDGHFVEVDVTGFPCVGQMNCIVCGDGRVQEGEACDDGNGRPGDGCDGVCQIEAGWECPTTGAGPISECRGICGDGITVSAEPCDDGDTTGGDGCSSSCSVESGWYCSGSPSNCTTTCGDGIAAGSEECDDGNPHYNDGCRPTCINEVCGNNVLEGDEECDQTPLFVFPVCVDDCSRYITTFANVLIPGTCFSYSSNFQFGKDCSDPKDVWIEKAGWYIVSGKNPGGDTNLGDFEVNGNTVLGNIEINQTRTKYMYLSADTHEFRICDDTGLGLGTMTMCLDPAPRISAPGMVSGKLTDSDVDGNRGEIDLAAGLSGGDECYIVDVLRTGSYRIVAKNKSGGGLLGASFYEISNNSTPPDGYKSVSAVGNPPFGSAVPHNTTKTGRYTTLEKGRLYHLCADTASLGSILNYDLTLEERNPPPGL